MLEKSQKFSESLVTFSVLGSYTLLLHQWGEIWHRRVDQSGIGPLLYVKFHTHQCNMSPLWGKKTQNHPLSNLNTVTLLCLQCCW